MCFAQTHFLKICVVTSVTHPGVGGAWLWGEEIARTPRSCLRFRLGLHTASKLQICKYLELDGACFCPEVWCLVKEGAPPGLGVRRAGALGNTCSSSSNIGHLLAAPGTNESQAMLTDRKVELTSFLKPVKPALRCHPDLKPQAALLAFYNSLTFSPSIAHYQGSF